MYTITFTEVGRHRAQATMLMTKITDAKVLEAVKHLGIQAPLEKLHVLYNDKKGEGFVYCARIIRPVGVFSYHPYPKN